MGAKMIVDAGIDGGAGQAEQGEKGVELFIPFPRGLFEAVEGLTKTTDEMFFTGRDEALGLTDVELLVEITV